MTIVSNPLVTVNIVNASEEVSNEDQKVLVIGQKVGSAVGDGELITNIGADNGGAAFGFQSQIVQSIKGCKAISGQVRVDAIGLDDAVAAVLAVGQIAIAGTATDSGSITVAVGNEGATARVQYGVGAVAATIAINLVVAVLASQTGGAMQGSPVAVAIVGGVNVTFTAYNGGTLGNEIGIKLVNPASFEGTGITPTLTAMAGGATDPTINAAIFDVIAGERYQTIIWPYSGANELSVITGLLDGRFNVSNDVLDGVAVSCIEDSWATVVGRSAGLNSENLVFITDTRVVDANRSTGGIFELPYVKSAMVGMVRALRLTPDASIGQYIISANGALDSFGGPALASKPYFNTPYPLLPLIEIGDGFSPSEKSQLIDAGATVLGNNTSKTSIIQDQTPTTYKTDAAGNDDITFKWLNYRDTASGAREYFFNNLRKRFAQSRLTQGNIAKGRDMANELVIKAYCEKLYQDLAGPEYVLVQDGEDAIQFFKQNLTVTLDMANGKATIQMLTPIVTQLRVIIATMKIAFSVEA